MNEDVRARGSVRALILELSLMVAAASCALLVARALPRPGPDVAQTPDGPYTSGPGVVMPNPAEYPEWSRQKLDAALRAGDAVIFGSSELTFRGPAEVVRFFPDACGKPVLAVGRDGFHSLPILLTLAEVRDAVGPRSDVTVIVSPGWLSEHGTPSGAFLRYLKPRALRTLLTADDVPAPVVDAIAREVRTHRDDFTGLYYDWLLPWWPRMRGAHAAHVPGGAPPPPPPAPRASPPAFDWDAAEAFWKRKTIEAAMGNPLGTDAAYFERWKSRSYPIAAPRIDPAEFEGRDLAALSQFLRARGVHAKFVVQPLHRRIYADLSSFDEPLGRIARQITADGHRWVDFFAESFDPAMLLDAVHFSAYGWVRVQREMCRP